MKNSNWKNFQILKNIPIFLYKLLFLGAGPFLYPADAGLAIGISIIP